MFGKGDGKQKKPSNAELTATNQSLAEENERLKKQIQDLQESKPSVAESATLDGDEAPQAEIVKLRSSLERIRRESQERIESLTSELEEARVELQSLMPKLSELTQMRIEIETLRQELLEAQAAKKSEDDTAAVSVDGEELAQLRSNATTMTEKLKSTNLELTKLAGIIEEHEATIRSQTETIEQLRKQLKKASNVADVAMPMDNAERIELKKKIEELSAALVLAKKESSEKDARLEELNTVQLGAQDEIAGLKLQLEELRSQSNLKPSNKEVYPVFLADAKARQERATQAINSLLEAKSKSEKPTATDKALDGIVETLTAGIKDNNPQTYFDSNKEVLKKHISTLRYTMKSLANTAVNAILTVLAVCSVVGITALWLTGTLQSNLQKNGSSFAFTTFGHKQKVERAMHEVEDAMGMGMKKGG